MSIDGHEMSKRIDLGVQLGVAHALAEHKKAGRSIVVWKDGRIVEIPSKDIIVPEVDLGEYEHLLKK